MFGCDILDTGFVSLKYNSYLNNTSNEISILGTNLKNRLQQAEAQASTTRKIATSFLWLAVVMISIVFLVALLIDLQRFVSFFMKNMHLEKRDINKREISDSKIVANDDIRSVFKKVIDKDNILNNRLHFKSRIKKIERSTFFFQRIFTTYPIKVLLKKKINNFNKSFDYKFYEKRA